MINPTNYTSVGINPTEYDAEICNNTFLLLQDGGLLLLQDDGYLQLSNICVSPVNYSSTTLNPTNYGDE